MFAPHHWSQVIISDLGIVIWAGAVAASIYHFGFLTTFKTYLVPYLWWVYVSVYGFRSI